ncbi:hypothetical protein [Kocuria flava]|uniref:hypothetical protein n=1 Tax=Kocuria flava TaxID=446860 RepID=UPI00118020B2|nr:hypothetical protein [Kocuria flava]
MRVNALTERYNINNINVNPSELARAVTEVHRKNHIPLLGVRSISYNNPLEVVFEVLPIILEEAEWAVHGWAALSLLAGSLAGLRKWQLTGNQKKQEELQIKIQEVMLEKEKVELDALLERSNMKVELEKEEGDLERKKRAADLALHHRRIEAEILMTNNAIEIIKKNGDKFLANLDDPHAVAMLRDISENIGTNLLRIENNEVTNALNAFSKISHIEEINIT